MSFDAYTAADLRVMHAQAAARADVAHWTASQVTIDCLRLAGDDTAWREADARWHILMAAGGEATEMMHAIAAELDRRDSEHEAARHDA